MPGPAGWTPWLPAAGPLRLPSQLAVHVIEDALAEPALPRLLPRRLRGISFVGLTLADELLEQVLARQRSLTWLDVRHTLVTGEGIHIALRSRRRLRHLAVDEAVAVDLIGKLSTRVVVHVDQDAAPVAEWSGLRPDQDSLLGLIRECGPASIELPGAITRAEALLDAGRPLDALALISPSLGTKDPTHAILAARCAARLGKVRAAIAALNIATPTPSTQAWRAALLVSADPVGAVQAATGVLASNPDDILATWARANALIAMRQFEASEQALQDLSRLQFDSVSTHRTQARLAESRTQHHRAVAAWQQILIHSPDDPDALAGLARAQRATRPLSAAWVRSLARAAAGDLTTHGSTFLAEVTEHRRAWARASGLIIWGAALVIASSWGTLKGLPNGIVFIAPLAAASVVTLLIWRRTPADVRDIVRRTDKLTGTHRAPDWRRGGAAVALTAVSLLMPGHIQDPEPCDEEATSACAPKSPFRPTVPSPSIPVYTPPTITPLPTSSFPSLPLPTPTSFTPTTR
ncbi:MAG: hypothetical protein ACR2JU_14600 [Nocardioidaceae bacterium]